MKVDVFQESAAAVARRFGVSAKALRVYERMGLLKPPRSAAGWRVYRREDLERIATIVALKQLGLPLKRIGEVLQGKGDLDRVLSLQEAALEEAKAEVDDALNLARAARRQLAARGSLSPDDLGNLVRSTAMTEFNWSPKMEGLAQKHFTPEQLSGLRGRPFTAEDQARVSAGWTSVFADIDALGPGPDVTSETALAIGRRAQALIAEFTQGDPALFKAAGAMNAEALKDPVTAAQMPTKPNHWAFLGQIFAELKRRGESVG